MGYCFDEINVLSENHSFLLEIHILLHFSTKIYELDERYISFLDIWDLSLINYGQTFWGFCFSEMLFCQKIMPFLPKVLLPSPYS